MTLMSNRYRLVPRLVIAAIAAAVLFAGIALMRHADAGRGDVAPQSAEPEIIHLTLTHPEFEVEMAVPEPYLGPRKLNLSWKNRQGGKQRRLLLEFYYPSLTPNTPEHTHRKSVETLMYASVTGGNENAIRENISRKLKGNSSYSPAAIGGFCKLSRLNAKENLYWHHRTFLYHRADSVDNDIIFDCADYTKYRRETGGRYAPRTGSVKGPCRMYSKASRRVHFTINGYPGDRICEWREFSSNLGNFIQQFIAEGGG